MELVKKKKSIKKSKERDKHPSLKPKETVNALDKYIIGQRNAKRSVAIALRNRWRRQQLPPELKDEVVPKNIIMIGPTGVGKTEIVKRLSKLTHSPFLKVEASKFTEVGYVGRDVESMIRDLTDLSKNIVTDEKTEEVKVKATICAEEKILDLLLPPLPSPTQDTQKKDDGDREEKNHYNETREKFRSYLKKGKLDDRFVEVELQQQQAFPFIEVVSGPGMDDMDMNLKDMIGNILPKKKNKKKVKVPDALQILTADEANKMIDMDKVIKEAIDRVEQAGIIFIDELDKVAGKGGGHGPDVSREGVQRDLLPIVEGSTVSTKYGMVKTDHILFIAAGAFQMAKPSDLIPELQGRFPIRVELESLGKKEFIRILTEPNNALTKQYIALLKTEGLTITFTDDSIAEISDIAAIVNERTENIGARRLHTIMERLFDEISFDAPDAIQKNVTIDAKYVKFKLKDIVSDEDLSRYIL